MKFTVSTKEMHAALKTALRAVGRSSLQAANCLLISADAGKGTVEVTGTDIRTTVIRRIKGVSVSESGSVIAPAVTADILRLSKSETVTAETDENGLLTLTFGNSRYELPTVTAESFPKCTISFPQSYITVRGLGGLLRKSAFAAERQGEMQSVQCVRIKLDAEKSRCEATDTKRMAMAVSSTAADGSLELLLHISAVNIIEALAGSGTVYVGTSPPLAVFIAENTVFATLMMNSGAPEMQKLLDRFHTEYFTETGAKELMQAVNTASGCLMPEDDLCVNIRLAPAAVIIKAAAYKRHSEAAVPALCTAETPDEGFNYNPRHITDFLKLCSDSVKLSMDRNGFMLLECGDGKYMVTPRKKAVIKEPKKAAKKKAA